MFGYTPTSVKKKVQTITNVNATAQYNERIVFKEIFKRVQNALSCFQAKSKLAEILPNSKPATINLRKLRCIPRSPPSRPGSRARRGLASPHAAPRRQAHPCLRSCPRPSARRSRSSSAPRLQEHWNLWKSEKYFFLKFDRSQHLSMHPFLRLDNPTGQFFTENRVARRLPSQSAGFIFRCLPARFARKKFRKIPTICQRVL